MIRLAAIVLLAKTPDLQILTDGTAFPRSALHVAAWLMAAGAVFAVADALVRLRRKLPAARHLMFSSVFTLFAVIVFLFDYGYVGGGGNCFGPCF